MFWSKRKSLGDILGTFNKTLSDLDALVARNDEQHRVNDEKIVSLVEQNLALNEEAGQARRVTARIKELVA